MAKREVAQQDFTRTVHDIDTYRIATKTHKRAKKSYIWQAGVGSAVTEVKSGEKFCLCRHCYDNPVPQLLSVLDRLTVVTFLVIKELSVMPVALRFVG
jgi:hypothetical protein